MKSHSKKIADLDYAAGELRRLLNFRDEKIVDDESGAQDIAVVEQACSRLISSGTTNGNTLKEIFHISA